MKATQTDLKRKYIYIKEMKNMILYKKNNNNNIKMKKKKETRS